MENLKISVITASYNMGHYIEQCFQGVIFQNYHNFEHIVIDGGSTDETITLLKKYEHIKWISESDNGLSNAFNKGLQIATGDIIGWCSADDYYLPGTFHLVNKLMYEDSSIDVLYGDYRQIDAYGIPQCIRREIDFDIFVLKYLHMNYIAPPAAFWKKKINDAGLLFDETLHFSMDYDFWIKVSQAGYRFSHAPVLFTDFRKHCNAKSSNPQQKNEHELIVVNNSRLLKNVPLGIRLKIRFMLLTCARMKRTFLRAVRGHYFEQWWRS